MLATFVFDSRDSESYRRAGGYSAPLLEQGLKMGAEFYKVSTFSIHNNSLDDLFAEISNAGMLAFVKGHRLITVDSDMTLSDLGLRLSASGRPLSRKMVREMVETVQNNEWLYGGYELKVRALNSRSATAMAAEQYPSEDIVDLATQGADAQGNKLFKRAGTITRQFRMSTTGIRYNVMISDDADEFETGYGAVNANLVEHAVNTVKLPVWNPSLRTKLIGRLDRHMVFNSRVIGNMMDTSTGLPIDGHIKAQLEMNYDLPDDVHFHIPREAIKHELSGMGAGFVIAGFEPQGDKPGYWDQQTVANHPFAVSIPSLRADLKDEAIKALNELKAGASVGSASNESTNLDDFGWNAESFNRMLKWNASAWDMYGMDYLDSPWLTERLGRQWAQKLGWEFTLREADDDSVQNWDRSLRIPITCGRRMQIISEASANRVKHCISVERGTLRKHPRLPIMVVNNLDYREILVPSHGGCDQDDFFSIMQREIEGENKYLVFRQPNTRGEYTTWDFVDGDPIWNHTKSTDEVVTFPKITKKRWPTQILKALETGETKYLDLPSKVDRNCDPGADIQAVIDEEDRLLNVMVDEGKPVDAMIGKRIRDARLQLTTAGIISTSKTTMAEVIKAYLRDVASFANSLPIPQYLEELGRNELYTTAVSVLKQSRFAMYQADLAGIDVVAAQNEVLMGFITHDDPAIASKAVMALWLAARTIPTKAGKFSDQPIFGTGVFHHIDSEGMESWPLLDALQYFGIASEPSISDRHMPTIIYRGNKRWNMACDSCGTGFLDLGIKSLMRFHGHGHTCKTCR